MDRREGKALAAEYEQSLAKRWRSARLYTLSTR